MEYSFILQKRLSVMKTLVKNSMHAEQRKICTAVLFLLNKYTTQPQSHKSQQFCCSIIVSSKTMVQLYLSKPSLELLYSTSINQNFNTPPETKHISYGTRYEMYNSTMYIIST